MSITKPETEITTREFRAGDEACFRRLNEEWITRYFVLEPKDEDCFAHPQQSILERGGRIFFAVRHGETVGCCALLAMGENEFEVAKMAVTESCQGMGIGRRLLEKVIAEARASGVTRLYLETNRKLAAAIRLYQSLDFRHLAPERMISSPYARRCVYGTVSLKFGPSLMQPWDTTVFPADTSSAATLVVFADICVSFEISCHVFLLSSKLRVFYLKSSVFSVVPFRPSRITNPAMLN